MDILRETDLKSILYEQNHWIYVDSETAEDIRIRFEVCRNQR